jgi:hypothetical protein
MTLILQFVRQYAHSPRVQNGFGPQHSEIAFVLTAALHAVAAQARGEHGGGRALCSRAWPGVPGDISKNRSQR